MKSINFYFPLRGDIVERSDDGCYDYEDVYEVYGGTLSEYKDEIESKFEDYLDGDDMSQYFDESDNAEVASVLQSMNWSFVNVNYELFGKVAVGLTDDISNEGIKAIKDFITGQNSDGLGEGFEQQDIELGDDRRLNLHMWSYDEYFMDTEEEFMQRTGLEDLSDSSEGFTQTM